MEAVDKLEGGHLDSEVLAWLPYWVGDLEVLWTCWDLELAYIYLDHRRIQQRLLERSSNSCKVLVNAISRLLTVSAYLKEYKGHPLICFRRKGYEVRYVFWRRLHGDGL